MLSLLGEQAKRAERLGAHLRSLRNDLCLQIRSLCIGPEIEGVLRGFALDCRSYELVCFCVCSSPSARMEKIKGRCSVMQQEGYLRAQLEEVKIRLIDQGCQTIGDAMRRDEEAFVRLVDICLVLGYGFSDEVLLVAREMKCRVYE